ncbi:ABC transporter substrate-binding protein [Phytoactinopolyspora mesophila]|uniref:Extracellular solute-binding protein n=1 Tax=Phytoactinopolyspora mesophila TaxID=2650750 RepID=A0A7K3MBP4_9ACTN|nr:sugar ABC transporter substrate-binding protein [Phytoactinopolyspora mesophila]NDL60741.1 extracellular solute-binding protein [Phytoactinopolyspora mesophila]
MRRHISIGVAAAASALVLAACSQGSATSSSSSDDEDEVTIHYMEFSSNGGNEENLAAIVDAFEEENPDIRVVVETTPYDDYFTKLQTAVAGNTEADAFELNYENFITYAESGALAELSGVNEGAYTPSLLEAFQYDGAQVGLPESFSDVVLFYNKDLFAEAGLDEPTSDWTWEDEMAAAEALTDTDEGVFGSYQPATFHEFYKALAQAGGQFLTDDGSAVAFDGPEGLEAASWLVDKPGSVMPTEAEGAGTPDFDTDLFRDGKLAMWHTGIWMFGPLSDLPFEWDIVVEPGNVTQASAMFTNGVVVSAGSDHPEEAQKWLEFLTSSDVMVDTRLEAGWELPPIADTDKLAPYLDQSPPANRQAVFDALEETVLPPVIASQQEMQDAVTEELGEAAAGRKSVEDAVADAADRVNALLN